MKQQLFAVIGRVHGADDDSLELIYAIDEEDAHHEFRFRIGGTNDDSLSDDEKAVIYIVDTQLIGSVELGTFTLSESLIPDPQQDLYVVCGSLMLDNDSIRSETILAADETIAIAKFKQMLMDDSDFDEEDDIDVHIQNTVLVGSYNNVSFQITPTLM